MGKVKALWQDKMDDICIEYEEGFIQEKEAFEKLCKLTSPEHAQEMLDVCIPGVRDHSDDSA